MYSDHVFRFDSCVEAQAHSGKKVAAAVSVKSWTCLIASFSPELVQLIIFIDLAWF